MRAFKDIFPTPKSIIGVIHLKGTDETDIRDRVRREVELYVEGGLDAVIFENYFGTYPQLEWALDYAAGASLPIPYGVNCLNFDSLCFGLAKDYSCDFLQLDSVVGHVKPRDEASLDAFFTQERAGCDAFVMGGVRFKYQPVLSEHSVEEDLQTAMNRCDAICVTGAATGEEASSDKILSFREAIGDFPLVICSGINDINCRSQLLTADAAVVGSFLKDTGKDTGDVCARKIDLLMTQVKQLREEL